VIEVDQGILNVYPGNYDYYLYKKEQMRMEEVGKREEAIRTDESVIPLFKKKTPYQLREDRKREAYQRDQHRRQLQRIEKRLQEVEKSLEEANQEMDQLNQRLSDPSLYINQKETYETVQAHKRTQQIVKDLSERWESLALELEEMKETRSIPRAE
jgi:ATP-binding cassette subfamily F protein 3